MCNGLPRSITEGEASIEQETASDPYSIADRLAKETCQGREKVEQVEDCKIYPRIDAAHDGVEQRSFVSHQQVSDALSIT